MMWLGGFVLCLVVFWMFRNKRELTIGTLVYHQKKRLKDKLVIVEKVRFKNAVECIKHYNDLVIQLLPPNTAFDLDAWTYNKVTIPRGSIEVFRFGNHIKLVKIVELNHKTKFKLNR